MKLRVMSDLHQDFHKDLGEAWLDSLPDVECDAMVIAGDIATGQSLEYALHNIQKRFTERIIFVPGNHDYWNFPEAAHEAMLEARGRRGTNLHCLLNETYSAHDHGVGFVGAPLWYEGEPIAADKRILGQLTKTWMEGQMLAGLRELHAGCLDLRCVAVTHHLPHPHSIHTKYLNEDNHAFYNERAREIVETGYYDVWIHGHTHESCDYVAPGGTRVVCNPYGYHGYEVNRRWDPKKVIYV